ncbi:T9SS type A sorting domain-containing protein [candidate division KSB1 bacterium]|nr:T9SS type A sorting domain-containing protein [candidate division KSB1 bacterium]
MLNPSGLDLRGATSWAWGDFDGDGNDDVLVRKGEYSSTSELIGYRGRGTAEPPYWIEAPELFEGIPLNPNVPPVVADFDGDGIPNLVTIQPDIFALLFLAWKKEASGNWRADTLVFSVEENDLDVFDRYQPVFADADGDRDLDLLVETEADFGKVGLRFFENMRTVSQPTWREDSTRLAEVYQNAIGYSSRSPILMRANTDSLMDLVMVYVVEGYAGVVVYPGERDASGFHWSGEAETLRVGNGAHKILPFDVDHDGHEDLLVQEQGTSRVYFKKKNGGEYFLPSYFRLGAIRSPAASSGLPFDYDHDQQSEILTAGLSFGWIDDHSGFESYQKSLLGDKRLWQNTGWFKGVSSGTAGQDYKFQLADLNRNGRHDLVLSLPPYILQSFEQNDSSLQSEWQMRNGLLAPFIMTGSRQDTIHFDPSFGDMDGDGDFDLLILTKPFPFPDTARAQYQFYENQLLPDTIVWKKRSDWLSGLGSNTYFRSSFVDLDHDGDLDLVFGTNEGALLACENSGNAFAPAWKLLPGVFAGIDAGADAAPSFGDFDNDGRADLFVGNREGELFFYRNGSVVGIKERTHDTPRSFELYQNYPNPFNPETKIVFDVPHSAHKQRVLIKIYDLLGRLVAVLFAREVNPGRHEVVCNGKDLFGHALPSGTYLYRLEAGNVTRVRRMTLVR